MSQTKSAVIPANLSDAKLIDLIIDSIQDVKGKNIVVLDLRALKEAPADYYIVCEGDSNTQIRAIGERVDLRVRTQTGWRPYHTEGKGTGRWVLVDYGNILVHVFHPEARAYYDIEDLWSDAKIRSYENL